MWNQTRASKLLGVEYPIFQGPFGGGLSSVALTATVSNRGGVGGFGAYTLSPDEIYRVMEQLKQATSQPFNINLWVSDHDVPTGQATAAEMEAVKALFRPYFEEAGVALPPQPATFKSRQFMSSLRQAALAQQKWELVLFRGGQIAPLLKHRKAAALMDALINETNTYFTDRKTNVS